MKLYLRHKEIISYVCIPISIISYSLIEILNVIQSIKYIELKLIIFHTAKYLKIY